MIFVPEGVFLVAIWQENIIALHEQIHKNLEKINYFRLILHMTPHVPTNHQFSLCTKQKCERVSVPERSRHCTLGLTAKQIEAELLTRVVSVPRCIQASEGHMPPTLCRSIPDPSRLV